MNENEFDIYIRNLMEEAEETVSPKVWKGVSASLDAPKRVVPVWMWRSLATVAAAAAVVAGVFLFHPKADNSQPVTILNPDAGNLAGIEEEIPTVLEQISLAPETRTAWHPSAVEKTAEEAEAVEEPAAEEVSIPTEVVSVPVAEDYSEDGKLLDALALTRERGRFRPSVALTAGGNMQGNNRPEIQPTTMRRTSMMIIPVTLADGISNESPETHFSLPFTVGVGVQVRFAPRWSIGTGLQYTNMSRTFVADYGDAAEGIELFGTSVDNHQNWLGVPLNVHFDLVRTGKWSVNAFAGGTAEYLVQNKFLVQNAGGDIRYTPKAHGLQYSTGVGVGVQFEAAPHVALYFDPSLRYYFDNGQPRSIRTIQPLRFDLQAGVRFTLGQ